MKWKKLYDIDYKVIKCITIALGITAVSFFAAGVVKLARGPKFDRSLMADHMSIEFVDSLYRPSTLGIYYTSSDRIEVVRHSDAYYAVVHELKHADNNQKFSYMLNTDANELSASVAGKLAKEGHEQSRGHVFDSLYQTLPNAGQDSPLENLIKKRRMKTGQNYVQAKNALLNERQSLIDSIMCKFDGALRDSLLQTVEQKYSEENALTTEMRKIFDKVIHPENYVYERDHNYRIIELDQKTIDDIFVGAMEKYNSVRKYYRAQRAYTFVSAQFHPLDDAELEKLFTYKINGVHRSLFKEASPEIQQQVRQMVNSTNLLIKAKNAMARE